MVGLSTDQGYIKWPILHRLWTSDHCTYPSLIVPFDNCKGFYNLHKVLLYSYEVFHSACSACRLRFEHNFMGWTLQRHDFEFGSE